MFLGPISEQHAPAGRDLEGAGRMLVGANLAQKSKADFGAGQCPRVIIGVNLSALMGASQSARRDGNETFPSPQAGGE